MYAMLVTVFNFYDIPHQTTSDPTGTENFRYLKQYLNIGNLHLCSQCEHLNPSEVLEASLSVTK